MEVDPLPEISCRSAFVSDIHLGSAGCKVDAIDQFLRRLQCERLYLVGDILDGWVGAREGKWNQSHANVIRTLLDMAKQGTTVYYTPGNHDSFMRRLNGGELGNTLFDHCFDHITPLGEKYLIVHGDLFDVSVTKYHPVAYVCAWCYEMVSMVNNGVNNRRTRRQLSPIDFCSILKRAVKQVVSHTTSYEDSLIEYAKDLGYHGVISGHVHRPRLETLPCGFVYGNAGDWVENCTALIEHFDGALELVWWSGVERKSTPEPVRISSRRIEAAV